MKMRSVYYATSSLVLNEDDLTPEMLAKIDHIRQDLGI